MINNSQKQLLQILLENDKSITELAVLLNSSQRLIYKNIGYCNKYFYKYCNIIKKDKLYKLIIFINKQNFLKLIDSNTNISQNERRGYLIYKLITDNHFNIEHERKSLDVSRSTIKTDINFIKEYVKVYNLNLEFVKNRYYISEAPDSLKILLLMKNFYLFFKNISISQIHRTSIENSLKNINLVEMKNKIQLFLKKYAIPITNDIVNFLLSYKVIKKLNRGLFLNKSSVFFVDYLYFFYEKNLTISYKETFLPVNELFNQSNNSFEILYQNFKKKLSLKFYINDIELSKKEELIFFKNLNFLLLKRNILNNSSLVEEPISSLVEEPINSSFFAIKNILKDIYDINISYENYCFIFLLQNIILIKKINLLKKLKILIFLDYLNKEPIDFLEKDIYNNFKINSINFDTEQELLKYKKDFPYLVVISNTDIFHEKYLRYSPEKHYEFLFKLKEYLIFY